MKIELETLYPIMEDLIQIADHHMETCLDCYGDRRGGHAGMVKDLEQALAWVRLQKALLDFKRGQTIDVL